MDAAALYASGNEKYLNEDYEDAIKHYTCAVTLQDCALHRSARAAAYLKVGKFVEALEDAAAALEFDQSCHMALYWRGISLFYLGDYAEAKSAFKESLRWDPDGKAPRQRWVRKCDAELSGSSLPLGGLTLETSKAPYHVSPTPAATASEPIPATAPTEQEPSAPVSSSSGLTISGRKPVKREWYQSDNAVFLTLFAKGVDKDSCKVDFQEQELSVVFPLPGTENEEYQLDLELYDQIDPSNCKVDVSKVKVELTLAKRNVGKKWKDLEKAEVIIEEVGPPNQPAYPTSNKAKKDWSRIDREVDEELKQEKPAGDEALNSLFKQIYDRADEDTRRAMIKSFQTSGGTVLSTNWGEVSSADYEGKDRPTPPDGQEWRDWRKK